MKQNDINELVSLGSNRLENIFNVYQTDSGEYYYNLLNTVNFNTEDISPSIYYTYNVVQGDSYTLVSYKNYKTISLWWLVCAINSIQDPTKLPEPGTLLKILNNNLVINILTEINRS